MMVKQFHRCWVPDLPGDDTLTDGDTLTDDDNLTCGDSLTGDLAHKYTLPANVIFIGLLSRFTPGSGQIDPLPETGSPLNKPDLLILISGPEPQRTRLEKIILEQAGEIKMKTVILQGLPGESASRKVGGNIMIFTHLDSGKIKSLLENSRYIICRGGYTGIMDLVTLGKPALIIPTPGQTEQEYLASCLPRKGLVLAMEQKNLDLSKAIKELEGFKANRILTETNRLDEEMDRWF